ncbi:MAG: hypothetical protein MK134_08840 [Dehalococcoidia bacterium]|nr:hypothetical protein [Dehalococcoidia bacterium]
MLPRLTALALVACSGGSDDEETAPEATSSRPVPTATAPSAPTATARPAAVPTATSMHREDRDAAGGA